MDTGMAIQVNRIATRYEKLARNFFGMLSLACAYIWLASLLTRPSKREVNIVDGNRI